MMPANLMKKSFAMLILIILLAGCQESPKLSEGKAELVVKTIGNTATESFGEVGMTALEMLKAKHDIKFAYGSLIECIDNVCAESGYWWPLHINGEKASQGAEYYIVKDKDEVEFILSKK